MTSITDRIGDIAARTEGDDGPPPPATVVLCLTPSSRQPEVGQEGASYDAEGSWSSSNTFDLRPQGTEFVGSLTIANLGITPSWLAILRFVAWGVQDGKLVVGLYQLPGPVNVAGQSDAKVQLMLDVGVFNAGFTATDRITHIYAVVEDPLFDPLKNDQDASNLLDDARKKRQDISENICRRSRRVACWIPTPAFDVDLKASTVKLTKAGALEVRITGGDATDSSEIGLAEPTKELWWNDSLAARGQPVRVFGPFEAKELVFRLLVKKTSSEVLSTLGYRRNNSGCRIKPMDGGNMLELRWNDSSVDDDYDDCVLRVMYR
jgi:hypothetical protein